MSEQKKPEDPGLEVAQRQCGLNQSVIVLRRAVLGLASCSVQIGRLVLFSDYGIEGDDRTELEEIDATMRNLLDRLGEFEDKRRAAVLAPVKDTYGATRD